MQSTTERPKAQTKKSPPGPEKKNLINIYLREDGRWYRFSCEGCVLGHRAPLCDPEKHYNRVLIRRPTPGRPPSACCSPHLQRCVCAAHRAVFVIPTDYEWEQIQRGERPMLGAYLDREELKKECKQRHLEVPSSDPWKDTETKPKKKRKYNLSPGPAPQQHHPSVGQQQAPPTLNNQPYTNAGMPWFTNLPGPLQQLQNSVGGNSACRYDTMLQGLENPPQGPLQPPGLPAAPLYDGGNVAGFQDQGHLSRWSAPYTTPAGNMDSGYNDVDTDTLSRWLASCTTPAGNMDPGYNDVGTDPLSRWSASYTTPAGDIGPDYTNTGSDGHDAASNDQVPRSLSHLSALPADTVSDAQAMLSDDSTALASGQIPDWLDVDSLLANWDGTENDVTPQTAENDD